MLWKFYKWLRVVNASSRFSQLLLRPIASFPLKLMPTTKASILEFLEHLGLAQYTFPKSIFTYRNKRLISLPLNILATNEPPGANNLTAMLRAANTS